MQTLKLLAVLALFSLFAPTASFAEDDTNRDQCISQVDGFLLAQSTRPLMKNAQGEWVLRTSYRFHDNFVFQVLSRFTDSNGKKLIATSVWAPGFTPECSGEVFYEADVVLSDRP